MRSGDADEQLAGRGVGHDLLPRLQRHGGRPRRLQLGVVRIDGSQGFGDSEPLRPLAAGDVPRVVTPRQRDTRGLQRRRVG